MLMLLLLLITGGWIWGEIFKGLSNGMGRGGINYAKGLIPSGPSDKCGSGGGRF